MMQRVGWKGVKKGGRMVWEGLIERSERGEEGDWEGLEGDGKG